MNDGLELAYLAGFIDGEGSIAIGHSRTKAGDRRWYLRMTAHQVNPRPLFRLKDRFGGSIIKTPRRGNQRTIYEWVTGSRMALAAIQELLPYLDVKREEAELAVKFQDLMMDFKGVRPRLTPEQEEDREEIYLQMRNIKRRSYDEA